MTTAGTVIRATWDERGKRLGLAVTEAVVVVGRDSGDAHAQQHDQAGDQVEAAVGQGAEHRHRPGLAGGLAFQRDQDDRHRDAGHRGAAVRRARSSAV